MSKILKITMIIVITFFTVILSPHERAAANPIAVGGALYLGGAGVYVVGALGIGAIAGVAGCSSCQQDIEEHAQQTWEGSTQLVKDGLQLMLDASIGVGNALTATDANFNTWLDSKIGEIASNAYGSKYGDENAVGFTNTYAGQEQQLVMVMSAQAAGTHMAVNGQKATEVTLGVSFKYAPLYVSTHYMDGATGIQHNTFTTLTKAEADALYSVIKATTTVSSMKGLMSKYGMSVLIGTAAKPLNYDAINASVSNTSEVWQDMKDAGLVLPTDSAIPMHNNIPLTYNPTNDTYAGIDGVTVPHEDVTGFKYQNPHWKSLQDLADLGLVGLGAGLYIDGWAGNPTNTQTYDPVTDVTTTTTTTTGTTTNVTTGETVSTGATTTTTTTTGDTTTTNTPTPEGGTPKTQTGKANRWGKLVTTKFPFSLPWDLFFILSFLNAEPQTPVFSIDERINKRENVEGIQIKFDIDLSFLDPYIPWFRRFIVLGFAFFLILNTRKLLGGAQ